MKKLMVVIFILIIVNITSAIRINEVELNPEGQDAGREWLELYSESHFDLSGLTIMNVKGKNISMNGSFSGFFIVNTPYSFLANEKQKLILFKDNEKIDETSEITDKIDDNRSWQLCSEWIFAESSKGGENNCENKKENSKDNTENNTQNNLIINNADKIENTETINKQPDSDNINSNIIPTITKISEETSVIKLIPKDIKSYKSRTQYIKEYSIYGFTLFVIILFIMLLWKKIVAKRLI
jgi:hypothetical protein